LANDITTKHLGKERKATFPVELPLYCAVLQW